MSSGPPCGAGPDATVPGGWVTCSRRSPGAGDSAAGVHKLSALETEPFVAALVCAGGRVSRGLYAGVAGLDGAAALKLAEIGMTTRMTFRATSACCGGLTSAHENIRLASNSTGLWADA